MDLYSVRLVCIWELSVSNFGLQIPSELDVSWFYFFQANSEIFLLKVGHNFPRRSNRSFTVAVRNRVLLQKLTVTQLVKNFLELLMQPEGV